jgi:hypothetical protein
MNQGRQGSRPDRMALPCLTSASDSDGLTFLGIFAKPLLLAWGDRVAQHGQRNTGPATAKYHC